MAYLYGPQNFDSLPTGVLADVTLLASANFTVGNIYPISGTQAYGTSTGGESNPIGLFTANNGVAIAPTQNMTIQFDQKWASGDYWMCPVLCADTANQNNYVWLLTPTNLFLFQHTGGSAPSPIVNQALSPAPTSGSNYTINASCSVSGSTVNHAFTIWPTGSSMPGTPTATATTTGPLSAGYAGILLFNEDVPGTASASVDNLFISTPSNPSITLTPSPSSVAVGSPTTVTASIPSGLTLGSSLVITVVDAQASTVSGTITIPNGSTSGTCTVNPSVDGTHNLSTTHTGGSGYTFTDVTDTTFTATPAYTTLGVTSTGFYASPFNWDDNGTGTKASGSHNVRASSTLVRSQFPGAYIKIGWSTATGSRATLLFDVSHYGAISSSDWPSFKYRVGNGAWHQAQVPSSGRLDITGAGVSGSATYQFFGVYMAHDYNNDVYGTSSGAIPQNSIVITGLELDSDATAVTPPIASTSVLLFGDSIPKGESVIGTNNGWLTSDDVTLSWAWQYAESLGAEIGFVCLSGWGYEVASGGGFPAFASHWQYQSNGRVRDTSILPTTIIEVHATNDYVQNTSLSTVQADVTSTLQAIRAAYSSSAILKTVPFGGFLQTQVAAGFTAAALSNATLYEPPAYVSAPINGSGRTYVATYASVDSIHLNYSWSGVAAASLAEFVANQSPAATDVRYGVNFGASEVGSCHVPTASVVVAGNAVDATTGNVVIPMAGEVELGVGFGANGATIGTFVGSGSGITLEQLDTALAAVPAAVWAVDGYGSFSAIQTIQATFAVVGGVRSGVPNTGSGGTITLGNSYGTITVDTAGNITATALTPPE